MTVTRPKTVFSWSSGKDSAYALYELIQSDKFDIVGLVTTISSQYGRVSMHGVREELLALQAAALGLPIFKISIPSPCSNEVYEHEMTQMIGTLRGRGITHFGFGDLFLEDIRSYRELKLAGTGMKPIFPLWRRNTTDLAREMLSSGLKAKLTCVDSRKLSADFAGHEFDEAFLKDIPSTIDPCGENGEFHTFVYESPIFKRPIRVSSGEIVNRDGFIFADIILCQ